MPINSRPAGGDTGLFCNPVQLDPPSSSKPADHVCACCKVEGPPSHRCRPSLLASPDRIYALSGGDLAGRWSTDGERCPDATAVRRRRPLQAWRQYRRPVACGTRDRTDGHRRCRGRAVVVSPVHLCVHGLAFGSRIDRSRLGKGPEEPGPPADGGHPAAAGKGGRFEGRGGGGK